MTFHLFSDRATFLRYVNMVTFVLNAQGLFFGIGLNIVYLFSNNGANIYLFEAGLVNVYRKQLVLALRHGTMPC